MPREIVGLDDTLKALRLVSPDINKEMKAEIRVELKGLANKAKGFLPSSIPSLSSWMNSNPQAKSRTSRERAFPTYEYASARKGITYSTGKSRANSQGWASFFSLLNRAASSAIIETAGRKSNMRTSAGSQSNNPNAGAYFDKAIESAVGGFYRVGTGPKQRGRLIWRAVNEDNGKTRAAVIDAINKAAVKFQARVGS